PAIGREWNAKLRTERARLSDRTPVRTETCPESRSAQQTVPSVPIQSGVAQSAEHPAVNRRVESSSLSPRAVSGELSVTRRSTRAAGVASDQGKQVDACSIMGICR